MVYYRNFNEYHEAGSPEEAEQLGHLMNIETESYCEGCSIKPKDADWYDTDSCMHPLHNGLRGVNICVEVSK